MPPSSGCCVRQCRRRRRRSRGALFCVGARTVSACEAECDPTEHRNHFLFFRHLHLSSSISSITDDPDYPGYDTEGGDPFDPAFLRRRAEERPTDWKRWLRLGYLLVQRCEVEAIPALERATSLVPQNGLAHYLLGRALCMEGHRARGAKELEEAVKLRPHYSHAWAILGSLRLDTGRLDDALEAWLHAARLAPDGDAYWGVARCFVALHRLPEATVALEEAVRLKPDHTVAHRALVCLGKVRGEPDVERRHLLRLFVLDEGMARRTQEDLRL